MTFVRLAIGRRTVRVLGAAAPAPSSRSARRASGALRTGAFRALAGVASTEGNGDSDPLGGTGVGGGPVDAVESAGIAAGSGEGGRDQRARCGRACRRATHALCSWSRSVVRRSACLNLRDVTERSVSVCDAARRASGFFWRSVGRHERLEEGGLPVGEVLVHREVAGLDAEPEEVLHDRQDDVVVAVVVAGAVGAVRAHDPERLQLLDPVPVHPGSRRHLLDRHLQTGRRVRDLVASPTSWRPRRRRSASAAVDLARPRPRRRPASAGVP